MDPLGSIQKNREISMAAKCQFGVRASNYFSSDNALPPVGDDDSTKGVRTTIPLVNRRGRSGPAPYQVDLAIEKPTH